MLCNMWYFKSEEETNVKFLEALFSQTGVRYNTDHDPDFNRENSNNNKSTFW